MKKSKTTPWTKQELTDLKRRKHAGHSHATIAGALGRSVTAVDRKVDRLEDSSLKHEIELPPQEFGKIIPLRVFNSGEWIRFGLVADTHLCCREERLDALGAHYDLMRAEGIKTVFHAGNIVDGFVAKINGASVLESSIDGQAQYCTDHYPY